MSNTLKRSLGLPSLTLYGMGAIIGAGIYVLIGEVAGAAGYYAPLSFLAAAIIALFSAFSYAELSARFPRSAGEAVYVQSAFDQPVLTIIVGILVIFTGIVSTATLTTGAVGYFTIFLDWPPKLVVLLFVLCIGAIAIWGIEQSAWMVGIITLIEVSGLAYIVYLSDGISGVQTISTAIANSNYDGSVSSGIFLGCFLAFFAFIGFEDMVNVAEEVKQPAYTLPRAILLALALATLLYVAVIVSALSTLAPEQLGNSKAPLADVVAAHGSSTGWIALISLIAVMNGAIVQLIMASRVIYGMANNRMLPKFLARVNKKTATPIRATVLSISITLLLALTLPLGVLAQATSIIVLCVFVLVNAALICINRRMTQTATVHFPNWIPWLGALLCVLMLALKISGF